MRLALIVPSFPKLSESFIVSKLLGLLDRGWDVHVICQTSEKEEWNRFATLRDRPDVRRRVHFTWGLEPRWTVPMRWPLAFLHAGRSPKHLLRYGREMIRRHGIQHWAKHAYLDATLIGLGVDLVHFEFGALAVGRMHLRQALGVPVTCSFRGYDLNFSGLETPGYYDEVWKGIDGVHVLGRDLWQRALRRGCPADKPHVLIPPAIDVSTFRPYKERSDIGPVGTPDRPFRILSVGRLEWKKGYEFNLQAVAKLVVQGISCEYRIVGGGSYLEAIAFARHQLNLKSVVELLGPQSADRVRAELEWADIFLHGAVSEAFCNSVIEAQAMQVPVVCSDAGGLPENIADGETGYVVPRRDPRAMADRLMLLARDPDLRGRMGHAGRLRVERLFRLEDQIDAFDKFYREILKIGKQKAES